MLHIVIYQPEIPENTGNIARTCVAFDAHLHLIRPYGFFLTDKNLKRSSVTYWDKVKLHEYDCYEDFVKQNNINSNSQIYYITRYGKQTSNKIKYDLKNEVYLMFGKESTGIDKQILKDNLSKTIRIPTTDNVRALNLSNCVAMLAYEYVKQNNFEGLELKEPFKVNEI
ncbi:MAG: tRNA (cytidine(34)-2'-O)-methyltransferase [Malacoplasma sp.]|nr:tRNA (cytidine(34)-2'-O)-methyltransferase [Malacoplasma sp.]